MADNSFFDESSEQSRVKSAIVSKYFEAWANVMIGTQMRYPQHPQRIAYVDLFAGPGRYKDGTISTPLLILQKAIEDEKLRSRLVTVFNDVNAKNTHSLQRAIDALPGIESLKYPPQIMHEEVGTEIVKSFEDRKLVPTLIFVDPWGYKGLSLRLVNSVLKDWGCDCIFFFNYNRINMGFGNSLIAEHMDSLFSSDRADDLRERLKDMTPDQRELTVVEELSEALRDLSSSPNYVLPFRFRNEAGTRTSHHLILVTKGFRGYELMKKIMAKESSEVIEGIGSFGYNPADKRQPILFRYSRPQEALGAALLKRFAGQSLTMKQVYLEHNVGTQFIDTNYKQVLLQLETEGKITADPPYTKRRKNSFADNVLAIFPPRPGT